MIKEAYCSYEVSKLLKEKGFDGDCHVAYYNGSLESSMELYGEETIANSECQEGDVAVPTQQMATAWIRERYNLHIQTSIFRDSSNDADGNTCEEWSYWSFGIVNIFDGQFVYQDYCHIDCIEYQSHDAAVNAALRYILTNW